MFYKLEQLQVGDMVMVAGNEKWPTSAMRILTIVQGHIYTGHGEINVRDILEVRRDVLPPALSGPGGVKAQVEWVAQRLGEETKGPGSVTAQVEWVAQRRVEEKKAKKTRKKSGKARDTITSKLLAELEQCAEPIPLPELAVFLYGKKSAKPGSPGYVRTGNTLSRLKKLGKVINGPSGWTLA